MVHMKSPSYLTNAPGFWSKLTNPGLWAGAMFALAAHQSSAQITNAFDSAIDPVYETSFASDQNGGFGFGAWTISVTGNGGHFIQGNGPSGKSFDLWNESVNSRTMAVRPFTSPLTPGQSFSFARRLNGLAGSPNTNAVILQDASGNTLFSFWHVGGDNANGHYADAATGNGTATGFPYNYQQFNNYSFKLTSPTTYLFRNLSAGVSFTGSITGTIAQVTFYRGNGESSSGGGQDFQFDGLQIVSDPVTFNSEIPARGTYSGVRTNVSVQAVDGAVAVDTATIVMTVDGATVTPVITPGTGITTISYAPPSPLSAGLPHSASVRLADKSGNKFTNSWSFTTGFPSLPAKLAGPITTSNGIGVVLFDAVGNPWIDTNYNASSSRTLFARMSMAFHNTADEPGNGGGGCYGGLHFFSGVDERLLLGETWMRTTWSVDTKNGGTEGEPELIPSTLVNIDEWHTIVARVDYTPGANATAKIWLDPDFTKTEDAQPTAPLIVTMNNTFDNIRFRCGNEPSSASATNIIIGALATDVGFAVPANLSFQGILPINGSSSIPDTTALAAQIVVGGSPVTSITLKLDGATVTPVLSTNAGIISVSYQPAAPLSAGTLHTAQLVVKDNNGSTFNQTWSFTTGFASLPVTVAGPITTGGGNDYLLFSAAADAWVGTNYNTNASSILYTRYSMVFNDLNNEVGSGGGYGGLHFMQDNDQRLIAGNAWVSLNWSLDAAANQLDLQPVTFVNLGEWHTIVVRTEYIPGSNDVVKVWLDPDFTQSEANQPNAPLTLSVNNSFNNVRLRCGNGTANATWTNIIMAATATGVGFPASAVVVFDNQYPADGSITAPVGAAPSVRAIPGTGGIKTSSIGMTIDGTAVTPVTTPVANGNYVISYKPATPFAAGSTHTVSVNLTDNSNTPFSTTWSFSADVYPSLPLTNAGPFEVFTDAAITVYSNLNGWVDGNYQDGSSNTLYTRFSMTFLDLNGETGNGGGFGGLQFFQGNSERLIVGNAWQSINWSTDLSGSQRDITPALPILFGEWHTLVVKTEYKANADDAIKVWLDPDFTKSEYAQPNAPLTFTGNNTFDNIRLRCGNGGAFANFSNIVFSATAPGVGFVAAPAPGTLSIRLNELSWTGMGTLEQAPTVKGPWTDAPSQSNPQVLNPTGAALFYRLRQ